MPRGDGTGPAGIGPMTGRAAGLCAGFPTPGFMNSGGPRGFRGNWNRGPGRGWRNRCWMPYYQVNPPQISAQQELDELKRQAEYLKESLNEINKRVEQLQPEAEK